MTPQEIFDKAVGGIIAQGGPSIRMDRGYAECIYRGEGGIRCAAGHVLPDEAYELWMDGKRDSSELKSPHNIGSVFQLCRHASIEPLREHYDLIKNLQTIHDSAALHQRSRFMAHFKVAARRLAEQSGFSTAVLDKAPAA